MTTNAGPVALTETEASELLAAHRFGVLATLRRDGQPHLATMLYAWDAQARTARFSTTATRLKATHLRRDARATLHVAGDDQWSYATLEGRAEVSSPIEKPGDEVGLELLGMVPAEQRPEDPSAFYAEAIAEGRVAVRLTADRLGGTRLDFGD